MASISINHDSLAIGFTRVEKVAGLLRDIEVPLSCVTSASVEQDGLTSARGVRAPGLAIPRLRKIGTWRGRGRRTAVTVRKAQPALRLTLRDHKYSELLIGAADAEQIASRLRAASPTGS